jgi:hypothetical protein
LELTVDRTQIAYSISFRQKNNLHYGMRCPCSKSFRRRGRQNTMIGDIFCIAMLFKMGSTS